MLGLSSVIIAMIACNAYQQCMQCLPGLHALPTRRPVGSFGFRFSLPGDLTLCLGTHSNGLLHQISDRVEAPVVHIWSLTPITSLFEFWKNPASILRILFWALQNGTKMAIHDQHRVAELQACSVGMPQDHLTHVDGLQC